MNHPACSDQTYRQWFCTHKNGSVAKSAPYLLFLLYAHAMAVLVPTTLLLIVIIVFTYVLVSSITINVNLIDRSHLKWAPIVEDFTHPFVNSTITTLCTIIYYCNFVRVATALSRASRLLVLPNYLSSGIFGLGKMTRWKFTIFCFEWFSHRAMNLDTPDYLAYTLYIGEYILQATIDKWKIIARHAYTSVVCCSILCGHTYYAFA